MGIAYAGAGRVRVRDVPFLATPESEECRTFVAVLFDVAEVVAITIATNESSVEIQFDPSCSAEAFGRKLADRLRVGAEGRAFAIPLVADARGVVRLHRHGEVVSSWRAVSDIPGRIRVRNDRLFRRRKLCHDIERELVATIGVDRFTVSPIACSVLVYYDTRALGKAELLTALDEILRDAEEHPHIERGSYEVLLSGTAVVLAAVAQFAAPILYIPAAVLFIYCVIPTFVGARRTLFRERRVGVDVLDAIVVILCLLTGEVFAGAVLAACLAMGRTLLERAREDSRRRLVSVFAKQARTAHLLVDGVEVQVPLDRVQQGDVVAVHTGEMIPVDGVILDGVGIVDQHALTGEAVPLEKEPGSKVYASTLVIGGRLFITVERAGKETTSARISTILNETAMYRLSSQSRGEVLADLAVLPTIALAALGYVNSGVQESTAIINCDFGTGIRMAAPLALLSALGVCAKRGILVKDGRALEDVSRVDTVLFDKTGTLTKELPDVAEVHPFGDFSASEVLRCAAAAERRLTHPIAAAIVKAHSAQGEPLPEIDASSYQIGYGISVTVEDREVRVGSRRFMRQQKISIPRAADRLAKKAHEIGNTVVYVGIDNELAGAIELAPTVREGIPELIAQLRSGGIKHIAIISGDHDKPTQLLAEALGVDRYFAEVLPEDKARYVESLQAEGRRVCFVGDGINDAIALRRANVSVSIRGGTTIATDAAQVVFMDEGLSKLGELIEISRALDRNVAISWGMILGPNLACIAGAFFLGFGVMESVVANNVATIGALVNGLRLGRLFVEERKILDAPGAEVTARPAATAPRAGERGLLGRGLRKPARVAAALGVAGMLMPGVPGWPMFLASLGMIALREFAWRVVGVAVPLRRPTQLALPAWTPPTIGAPRPMPSVSVVTTP